MNTGDLDILRVLADLGGTVWLIISIWALATERVVPGARCKELERESRELARTALEAMKRLGERPS